MRPRRHPGGEGRRRDGGPYPGDRTGHDGAAATSRGGADSTRDLGYTPIDWVLLLSGVAMEPTSVTPFFRW
ncbi:hypothetical protein GCM10010106_24780 [Thermopolyspora flexuosa]|nr:hypothetical protein GCM10010106_24780 [Thermopolyspora flexuosa]